MISNHLYFVLLLHRLFPNASIIVELQHATNMRFMKFNADPCLDFSGDSMASLRESMKVLLDHPDILE